MNYGCVTGTCCLQHRQSDTIPNIQKISFMELFIFQFLEAVLFTSRLNEVIIFIPNSKTASTCVQRLKGLSLPSEEKKQNVGLNDPDCGLLLAKN